MAATAVGVSVSDSVSKSVSDSVSVSDSNSDSVSKSVGDSVSVSADPVWRAFGAIRCIHMPARADRAVLVRRAASKARMPVTWFHVSKHPDGGVRGCYESHLAVMREALAAGLPNVLVFEDDIEVAPSFRRERVAEVARFMAHTEGAWDILFLGCFPDIWRGAQTWVSGHMYAVRATQTHAYIVSAAGMLRLAHRPFDGKPIDEVLRDEARCYATLPSLFTQALSQSDVSSIGGISTFGGKRAVTAAVEAYAVHIGAPLRSVLLALLLGAVAGALALRRLRAVRAASARQKQITRHGRHSP